MTRKRTTRGTRPAFTMIELLIVVAIIAVLVSLLAAGVFRVMALGNRTEVASDIMKMDQSLKLAMQKYNGIQFLPSQLILYNDISKYRSATASAFDKQSANVLRAMFGRRFISNGTMVAWGVPEGTTLNGAECLVFYLGGIQETWPDPADPTRLRGRCLGFSSNPQNPTAPGGDRIGPLFEFKLAKLRSMTNRPALMYEDAYGMAYAFFGPTSANGYNAMETCFGMTPYSELGSSPTKFLNPNTFQIVSAGPNKAYGSGGQWDVKNGSADEATRDNLTNFSQSELGDGQQ